MGTLLVIAKFFFSPLGKVLLIGAGLLTVAGMIHRDGTLKERARWQVAEAKAERDAAQRDLTQTEIAGDDDDRRLASILSTSKTNQERFDAFKVELAKRSDSVCRLSAGDLERLRVNAESDAKGRSRASSPAQDHGARAGTAAGRDCRAALADYVGALDEANGRLSNSRQWYGGIRARYRTSPLNK